MLCENLGSKVVTELRFWGPLVHEGTPFTEVGHYSYMRVFDP